MKKRTAEARWIEKESRWRISVQNQGDRRTFYSSVTGKKGKHEAERKADEWLEVKTLSDIKHGALFGMYLKANVDLWRKTTLNVMQSIYDNYLYCLNTKYISTISTAQYQAIVNSSYKNGKGKATCIQIKSLIIALCNYAISCNFPVTAPNLTVPKNAHQGERGILQPDDLKILFNKNKNNSYYINLFRFSAILGLRRGELIGLQWSDIVYANSDIATLYVSRAINSANELTVGKTKNAKRQIILPQIALDVLESQKELLHSNKIISEWIFPHRNGSHSNASAIYYDWNLYCQSNNIAPVPFHSLRHTMISLSKSDVPVELLKRIVGHSTSMDTFGTYGHVVDGELHQTAKTLNAIYSNIITTH